jgi:hypothetical protein
MRFWRDVREDVNLGILLPLVGMVLSVLVVFSGYGVFMWDRGPTSRGAALDEERKILKAMVARQETLDARLTAMEEAIKEDPAKVLSVPLLRKDFENLQLAVRESNGALHNEIGRLYSFLPWLIGLLVTINLALMGFFFSTLKDLKEQINNKLSQPE